MRAKYRLLFFDVDSTLVTIEGVDVLGGGNPEIAAMTEAAMSGRISVDEVYARRLELIRPSRAAVEDLGRLYQQSLVSGVEETFASLRAAGAQLHLLTAGIAQAILPLASKLEIPERAVHAVPLRFDARGEYEDFDRRSLLVRQGGKELVVRALRARSHGTAALVGDGATDLEARSAVDCFIGFGGVHVREKVKENADVFVTDFRAILPHLVE